MNLDPLPLKRLTSVFVAEPPIKPRHSESGRIRSKLRLNGLKRQTGRDNQIVQYRRQFLIFEIPKDAVVMRRGFDMAALAGFSQIRHEAASRHRAEHFERGSVNDIAQRESALPASSLRNGRNIPAKIGQQDLEVILLRGLREIVSGPILLVRVPLGDGERFDYGRGPVGIALPLNDKLDGENVLTQVAAKFVVRAIALGIFPDNPHAILDPAIRWFPADEALREKGADQLMPPLVRRQQLRQTQCCGRARRMCVPIRRSCSSFWSGSGRSWRTTAAAVVLSEHPNSSGTCQMGGHKKCSRVTQHGENAR